VNMEECEGDLDATKCRFTKLVPVKSGNPFHGPEIAVTYGLPLLVAIVPGDLSDVYLPLFPCGQIHNEISNLGYVRKAMHDGCKCGRLLR
jgi:hypothetical protein